MSPFHVASAARTAGTEAAVQKVAAAAVLASQLHSSGGAATDAPTGAERAEALTASKRRSFPFIGNVPTTPGDVHAAGAVAPAPSRHLARGVRAARASAAARQSAERTRSSRRQERVWRGLAVAVLAAAARGPAESSLTPNFHTFIPTAVQVRSTPSAAYLKRGLACALSAGIFTRSFYVSLADDCIEPFLRTHRHQRTSLFMHRRRQHGQQEHRLSLTECPQALRNVERDPEAHRPIVSPRGFLSHPQVANSSNTNSAHVDSPTSNTERARNFIGSSTFPNNNLVTSNCRPTHVMGFLTVALHTAETAAIRRLRGLRYVTETSRDAAEGPVAARSSTDKKASNLTVRVATLCTKTVTESSARGTTAPLPAMANAVGNMAAKARAAAADLRPAAVLFSPPFPRAVPLAYEILEPAKPHQKQEQATRQQPQSELLLPCSKIAGAGTGTSAGKTAGTAGAGEPPDAAVANKAVGVAAARKGEESHAYPLVVVLHGMFHCRDNMKALCARLDAEKVVAADLRNHGDSPFTRTMFMQDMAADVLLLLQHLRKRFPHISRCILVGHSLGGQVAMAAAIRSWYASAAVTAGQRRARAEEFQEMQGAAAQDRAVMRVEGVVTLDICPVNYYRWPLPSAGNGQQNVRDLVELVGNLDLRELEEQLRQQRELHHQKDNESSYWQAALSAQADTSWKDSRSRSLLALLVEDTVEEVDRTTRSVHNGKLDKDGATQSTVQQQPCREHSTSKTEDTKMRQQKNERRQATIKEETCTSTKKRRLRWRMNIQSLRDSFRSETLKWDVPLPVQGSDIAAAAAAGAVTEPLNGNLSSPRAALPTAAAGRAAVDLDVAGLPGDEQAVEFMEREYESVAGFKEPPPGANFGTDRPMLVLRGSHSPWVDVDRHWKDVTAFFPSAQLQTVPAAGHAVHDDQLEITAAAINGLLRSEMQKNAAQH